MKPEPTQPQQRKPSLPARQLRITSIRSKHSPETVEFEIHDESVSLQKMVTCLVMKHDLSDVYEIDSTVLDIWVTSK